MENKKDNKKKRKKKQDINELAFNVVQKATQEKPKSQKGKQKRD